MSRKTITAWALYDFANSSFPTIIGTFIYAAYFTKAIAADEVTGLAQWSWAMTTTGLAVAVLSPYLGALADVGRYRKRFLACCIGIASLGAAVLYFPVEGQVLFALCTVVVAQIAYEMGNVFYNAYLPGIVSRSNIGRVSGLGLFFGYAGGLACLVIALFGLVQTETPLLGFSTEGGANVRAANLLVAVWFVLFSLPILLGVRSAPAAAAAGTRRLMSEASRQLLATLAAIRQQHRQVFRFLLARLLYNDGLLTIFAFGGIYAAGTFDFEMAEVIVFGIALNVMAGIGALAFGYVDDRLGGKKTIYVTLVGLCGCVALGVWAPSAPWFWVAGLATGLLVGPNQAASRSLMGRFVPRERENEFFGFYAFSGKATAFLGPLLLGQAALLFDSQRAGMATILLFFVAGILLLVRVDEREGISAASQPPSPGSAVSAVDSSRPR